MHLMFCVSGYAGTGKDEFCKRLVSKHSAVHTGLVDPAKRHLADVYGFSRDQLFGPSSMRNAGDPRYPKTVVVEAGARPAEKSELLLDTSEDHYTDPENNWWCADFDLAHRNGLGEDMTVVWGNPPCVMIGSVSIPCRRLDGMKVRIFFEDTDPRFFLSPREALQQYCGLLNQLYPYTWVRLGVETHRRLAAGVDGSFVYAYDRLLGLVNNGCQLNGTEVYRSGAPDAITCFSDFRHWDEIRYVRQAWNTLGDFVPVLIRVRRPGIEKPPYNHKSETEQATIPDSEFDFIVDNNHDVAGLYETVDRIVELVKAKES